METKIPIIPAAFFGIVLGLAGLGFTWRWAHLVWGVPRGIGEGILLLATLVWVAVLGLFIGKWIYARGAALAEVRHPVQCCFIGLAGIATMLIALAALPYAHELGRLLYFLGAAFTIAFAVWRTGALWLGGRDPATNTPVMYLPAVAGGFVTATGAVALGYPDWGRLAFGGGVLTWIAIESVLLHRFYTGPEMPPALRPTMGVQMAPPVVGAVAWLAVNGGQADLFAQALIGYGVFQALLMLRLLPWLLAGGFSAGFWSFTFGATALAAADIRIAPHGGALAVLAPVLFIGANAVVAVVALGTVALLLKGRLLPRPVAVG